MVLGIQINTLDLCSKSIEFDDNTLFKGLDYKSCCYKLQCDGFHHEVHVRILWF